MKRTVILITLLCYSAFFFAQDINQVVTNEKGTKMLISKVDKKGLIQAPFADWFNKNYEAYLENDKVIKALKENIGDYEIKAFFGSWCGDSRRELPKFYKVLDAVKFPKNQLEVIALDRESDAYKQSPTHEEKGLNVHRVPTFIFYKDGKEVNRIVESPKETLERDILKIVTNQKYTPNYNGVLYVNNLFKNKTLDQLKTEKHKLANTLSDYVEGRWELNTYGYVLLSAKELDKSIFVFTLNTILYPNKYNVYDSLGEALYTDGKFNEATKQFHKVLSLNPEHKNAKAMLKKMESEVN